MRGAKGPLPGGWGTGKVEDEGLHEDEDEAVSLKRTTSQNFIIGIFFVIGGLVLAAINKIDPVSAAILNVTGSLIVVFNSARLVREGEDFEAFDALGVDSNQDGDYFPEDSGEVATVSP